MTIFIYNVSFSSLSCSVGEWLIQPCVVCIAGGRYFKCLNADKVSG